MLGGLNNAHIFLTVPETGKSKIKVLTYLVPNENIDSERKVTAQIIFRNKINHFSMKNRRNTRVNKYNRPCLKRNKKGKAVKFQTFFK